MAQTLSHGEWSRLQTVLLICLTEIIVSSLPLLEVNCGQLALLGSTLGLFRHNNQWTNSPAPLSLTANGLCTYPLMLHICSVLYT